MSASDDSSPPESTLVDVVAGRNRRRRRLAILAFSLLSAVGVLVAVPPALESVLRLVSLTRGPGVPPSIDSAPPLQAACRDSLDRWWTDQQWHITLNADPHSPVLVQHGWNDSTHGQRNGPALPGYGVVLLHPKGEAPATLLYVGEPPRVPKILVLRVNGAENFDVVLGVRLNRRTITRLRVPGGTWRFAAAALPALSAGDSLVVEAISGGLKPEARFEQLFIDEMCFADDSSRTAPWHWVALATLAAALLGLVIVWRHTRKQPSPAPESGRDESHTLPPPLNDATASARSLELVPIRFAILLNEGHIPRVMVTLRAINYASAPLHLTTVRVRYLQPTRGPSLENIDCSDDYELSPLSSREVYCSRNLLDSEAKYLRNSSPSACTDAGMMFSARGLVGEHTIKYEPGATFSIVGVITGL